MNPASYRSDNPPNAKGEIWWDFDYATAEGGGDTDAVLCKNIEDARRIVAEFAQDEAVTWATLLADQ